MSGVGDGDGVTAGEGVAPGVIQIDTRLGGHDRLTAGYLLDGARRY